MGIFTFKPLQVLIKTLFAKIRDEAKGQGLELIKYRKSSGKKKKLGNY